MVALNTTVLGVTDVKSFLQRTAKAKSNFYMKGKKKKTTPILDNGKWVVNVNKNI